MARLYVPSTAARADSGAGCAAGASAGSEATCGRTVNAGRAMLLRLVLYQGSVTPVRDSGEIGNADALHATFDGGNGRAEFRLHAARRAAVGHHAARLRDRRDRNGGAVDQNTRDVAEARSMMS